MTPGKICALSLQRSGPGFVSCGQVVKRYLYEGTWEYMYIMWDIRTSSE